MKHNQWIAKAIAITAGLSVASAAFADATIATFDETFLMSQLFGWSDATVVADANGFSITDTGYGSGYKVINPVIDATGNTNLEMTVTLSGPPAADGFLGPIVKLVDGDGTGMDFAWYGRTLGHHVLNADLLKGGILRETGADSKLDISTLTFFHLQLDPSTFQGQYTVRFETLRVTGPAGPVITAQSYNLTTREFTLVWSSAPGKTYTILQSANLAGTFNPLVTGVPADGASTTNTVVMPVSNTGFLRVAEEP
jgi:hypothetical protein